MEKTLQKYNEKWQQRGQQCRLVGDVGWQGKIRKKIQGCRKILRLEELLVKFCLEKTHVEKG